MNGFVQDLKACDWLKEIGYEIMKQSGLRELKRRRFLRALWATGITYLVVATIQILRHWRHSLCANRMAVETLSEPSVLTSGGQPRLL